ncbi:hypothetical protein N6H14_00410 [Paenibacillus sp. CC-CFT747]|nr:hypothetical protein N6H14_00410 [Paenibacillus sp. CC-CFT747]
MEGEKELRLIEPSADWEKEYKEMLEDWQRSGEKRVPFVLDMDARDFPG